MKHCSTQRRKLTGTPIYAGSLFAFALSGYAGIAHGQLNCESEIEQLRGQLDESQRQPALERRLRELLSRAEGADNGPRLVSSAEQMLVNNSAQSGDSTTDVRIEEQDSQQRQEPQPVNER